MSERPNDQIRELLAEVDPAPEFPRQRLLDRIEATVDHGLRAQRVSGGRVAGWWLRPAAAVAASLLIFVAGVEYGRGLTAVPAGSTGESPAQQAVGDLVSFSIQERGTAYLAEVARMAESADSMTPEQLEEARQVALAILYGAAMELVRAAPDDQLADAIARSLRTRRRDDSSDLIWF